MNRWMERDRTDVGMKGPIWRERGDEERQKHIRKKATVQMNEQQCAADYVVCNWM